MYIVVILFFYQYRFYCYYYQILDCKLVIQPNFIIFIINRISIRISASSRFHKTPSEKYTNNFGTAKPPLIEPSCIWIPLLIEEKFSPFKFPYKLALPYLIEYIFIDLPEFEFLVSEVTFQTKNWGQNTIIR